jgi:hypothetical protein
MARTASAQLRSMAAAEKRGGNLAAAEALLTWASLEEPVQRQLAYEIAEARHDELCIAYPQAVSVGHGFRKKGYRPSTSGAVLRAGKVTEEPCVIFTVKKKWKKTPGGSRSRDPKSTARRGAIPPYLLTHATGDDGRRILCAVPTDIRCLAELKARPHAAAMRTDSTNPAVRPQLGMAACVVTRPDVPGLFVMSCHHVFAMSVATTPRGSVAPGVIARLHAGGNIVGTLATDWIGRLSAGGASFDAALCQVAASNVPALRLACSTRATRTTENPNFIPTFCAMTNQNGATINLRFVAEHFTFRGIGYFGGTGPQPVQPRVLEFFVESGPAPIGGDSGSAVMTRDGGEFVGMHLAGVLGTRTTFALPAYELSQGARFGQNGLLAFQSNF